MITDHPSFLEISYFGITICFGRIESVTNEFPYHKAVLALLQQIHIVSFGKMSFETSKTFEDDLLFAMRTLSDLVVPCWNFNLTLTERAVALLKLFGSVVIKDIVLVDAVLCHPFTKILWRRGCLLQILVPRVSCSFVLLHQSLIHNAVLEAGDQFYYTFFGALRLVLAVCFCTVSQVSLSMIGS